MWRCGDGGTEAASHQTNRAHNGSDALAGAPRGEVLGLLPNSLYGLDKYAWLAFLYFRTLSGRRYDDI
jgi:hypothetical protein